MTLPTVKQSRLSLQVTPLDARVLLVGMPKAGKTTIASGWSPETTLMVDTHKGTTLLEGEHYVAHVANWPEFLAVVDDLAKGEHEIKTVVLDLVDDLWHFVDRHYAGKGAVLASATEDYGRSGKTAEGMFREQIGRLLASEMGVWFLSHTKEVQEGNVTRYTSKLDNKVITYVQGACQFVFLAETLGTKRVLHTQPSAKFEAGSRVPLPEPLPLEARALYAAMAKGLAVPSQNGKDRTAEPELVEAVAA